MRSRKSLLSHARILGLTGAHLLQVGLHGPQLRVPPHQLALQLGRFARGSLQAALQRLTVASLQRSEVLQQGDKGFQGELECSCSSSQQRAACIAQRFCCSFCC